MTALAGKPALNLQTDFGQARALDIAQKSSASYKLPFMPTATTARKSSSDNPQRSEHIDRTSVAFTQSPKYFFSGYGMHQCSKCASRDSACSNCQKKGQYKSVCRSKCQREPATAALIRPALATVESVVAKSLSKACVDIAVNDKQMTQILRLKKHETI